MFKFINIKSVQNILFIKRKKKALKYLVEGPVVRKNLSVIESYTRVMSRTKNKKIIVKIFQKI